MLKQSPGKRCAAVTGLFCRTPMPPGAHSGSIGMALRSGVGSACCPECGFWLLIARGLAAACLAIGLGPALAFGAQPGNAPAQAGVQLEQARSRRSYYSKLCHQRPGGSSGSAFRAPSAETGHQQLRQASCPQEAEGGARRTPAQSRQLRKASATQTPQVDRIHRKGTKPTKSTKKSSCLCGEWRVYTAGK
jgi:hypothetical protein